MGGLVILIAAAALGPARVEKDGVRIRVDVRAHVYTYTVVNLDASPITRFEIEQHNAYDFQAPDGWEFEAEQGIFRAWATGEEAAIRYRQPRRFTMRVSSKGAVLGPVEARMSRESGDSVVIADLWGISPEPRATILLVSFVVTAVILIHAWLLARRDRRAAVRAVSAA
jgi:hypothetical protein